MSFLIYDLTFLVVFTLAVGLFIYFKRDKFVREGPLFLYKTSIGLKFMEKLGKKYPKTLKVMSWVVIFTGFILLIFSIYFLIDIAYKFTRPEFVQLVKIPPIMPLIPYLPDLFKATWLPPFYFTYWIIAIAIVAIFHEGFHGIFAKFHGIRIKSSGFGFLGPFLAFFVEQDEKQMKKAKPFAQMTVSAAGVFANVILTIIFLIILIGFFKCAYAPAGVYFSDYTYSVFNASEVKAAEIVGEQITIDGLNFTKVEIENKDYLVTDEFFEVDDNNITDETPVKVYWDSPAINTGLKGAITSINNEKIIILDAISKAISDLKPGDAINITTKYKNGSEIIENNYELVLGRSYLNESRQIIGISSPNLKEVTGFRGLVYKITLLFRDPAVYYEPKAVAEFTEFFYILLLWLVLINFGVALANMWPVAVFDGGFFVHSAVFAMTKSKKAADMTLKICTWIFLAILAVMMVFWAIFSF